MDTPKTSAAARKHTTPIGLVGLGLMGQGIATCLLAYGFRVIAYSRTPGRFDESLGHISRALKEMVNRKVLDFLQQS